MALKTSAISAALGLLALASGGAAATDAPTPEETFKAASATWAASYNAGNAAGIEALYADDAVVMPPNATAVAHAGLHDFLTRDMANSKAAGITLGIASGKTGRAGDLAWHDGTYTITDKTGKTVGTGKYVEIWQRSAGKWAMVRDIWNDDAPAAAPATPAPPAG